MSDYSESGAQPIDDAAVDDPPTVDEVRRDQDERYPEQAATRREGGPPSPEELADPEDERQAEGLPDERATARAAERATFDPGDDGVTG